MTTTTTGPTHIFSGFPSGKVRTVALPEQLFAELIPLIDDLAELKLTLHVLWRLGTQRAAVRCLSRADLEEDQLLRAGLGASAEIASALARAVERGTLLRVVAAPNSNAPADELYFANSPRGRAAVASIARGQWPAGLTVANRPNIFTLYEQNIGLLTPLISDELRQAELDYPAAWIESAFREAVAQNKRNWKYIRAILERWRAEGKGAGRGRRDPFSKAERWRYIEGEYGKYIKH